MILGNRKKISGQSRIEVIDVIELVTSILGKKTPNLAIYYQIVNWITNFIWRGRGNWTRNIDIQTV